MDTRIIVALIGAIASIVAAFIIRSSSGKIDPLVISGIIITIAIVAIAGIIVAFIFKMNKNDDNKS